MTRLTLDRLDALLERMREIRTLVVGDLMLDVYLRGTASRISPEAPVPVVRVQEEWRALGGAANVASNVVALGAAAELVGLVGADRSGEDLLDEIDRLGIGRRGVLLANERPTTVKTRIMARHQQVARFDVEAEDDLDDAVSADLISLLEELAPRCDAIALEDYNKGVLTPTVIAAALDLGREHGIPVVVDPKARNFFAYDGATVFKPNLVELGAALRGPVHYDDPEWLSEVRHQLACGNLLVTLGEGGMALLMEGGEYLRVPTVARSVYDVSGAGDTVTAVLATALAAGAGVAEAAVLANHAAGIEVGKVGVATVSPNELREAVERYQRKNLVGSGGVR